MTRRRRLLALAALSLLAVSAGCSVFGGGEIDRDKLDEEGSYDDLWNGDATVTISVEKNTYRAVYHLSNQSTISVFRFHRFNNERSVDPIAVRYRYPDGTIVGPDSMEFEKSNSKTTITLPDDEGKLAMTLPKSGKRIRVPTVVDGSYEIILPPDGRVEYFLLGRVSPSEDERTVEDGRVHLHWESVERDGIVVRYYLVRDAILLGGLIAVATAIGFAGVGYFLLQLRGLRERREEVAWDDNSGP